MASNFLRTPSLGTSPLQGLATYFEKARRRAGIISLPDDTLHVIRECRAQGAEHSTEDVSVIVRTLESGSDRLSRRLDPKGLVVVCSVLVHSQTCLAQQRGLYLIKEALCLTSESAASQSVLRLPKKIAVGAAALISLVRGFARRENTEETRRWMGVLALELLQGCPQNIATLKADHSRLPLLGAVIEHGQCQVLELLAGSMINIMLNHGVKPEFIWPDKTDLALFSSFPIAQQQDTQWVTSFEVFVEDLEFNNVLTQERASVIFAYALSIGDHRHSTEEESAILVTVSKNLTIIIPDSTAGPATYIDIHLHGIDSFTIEGQTNSQSQTPFYVVIIHLSSISETCHVNACAKNYDSVALAFETENDAKALGKLIQPRASGLVPAGRVSHSEGISVSQGKSTNDVSPELIQDGPAQTTSTTTQSHSNNIFVRQLIESPILPRQLASQAHHASEGLENMPKSPQINAASRSSSGDQVTDNASLPKMSKRLRDNGGSVERTSTDKAPKASAKMDSQKNTKVEPDRIAKAAISKNGAKTKKHLGQAKPDEKPSRIKVQQEEAVTGILDDHTDEYELRTSPEPPNITPDLRSSKAITKESQKRKKSIHKGATAKSKVDSISGPVSKARATKAIMRRNTGSKDKPIQIESEPFSPARITSVEGANPTTRNDDTDKLKSNSGAPPRLSTQPRKRREAARKAIAKIHGVKLSDNVNETNQDEEASPDIALKNIRPEDQVAQEPQNTAGQVTKEEATNEASIAQPRKRKKPPVKTLDSTEQTRSSRKKIKTKSATPQKPDAAIGSSDSINLLHENRPASRFHSLSATESDTLALKGDQQLPHSRSTSIPKPAAAVRQSKRLRGSKTSVHNGQEGGAEQAFIPDSVPKNEQMVHAVEQPLMVDPIFENSHQPGNIGMMGEIEGSHFREAMGSLDDKLSPKEKVQAFHTTSTEEESPPRTNKGLSTISDKRSKAAKEEHRENKQAETSFRMKLDTSTSLTKAARSKARSLRSQDENQSFKSHRDANEKPHEMIFEQPMRVGVLDKDTQTLNVLREQPGDKPQREGELGAKRLPQVTNGVKRKAEDDNNQGTKKKKTSATVPPGLDKGASNNEGRELLDWKTPTSINRKSGLISWDTTGPKNQGIPSTAKKPRGKNIDLTLPIDNSMDVESNHVSSDDDLAPSEHYQQGATVRWQNIITPRRSRSHISRLKAEPKTPFINDKPHRLSSQSSKVNQNGSPLATALPHFRDRYDEGIDGDPSLAINNDYTVLGSADWDNSGTQRVATEKNADSKKEVVETVNIARNRKQIPSSPRAPSTFDGIDHHRVLDSGVLINEKTLESIMPTLPQDPFVDGGEKPPSSFVRLLRKSNNVEIVGNSDTEDRVVSPAGRKRKSINGDDDDPEKTLVEPELQPRQKRQKLKHSRTPCSSSTPQSSSQNVAPTETTTEDETDYELQRWMKTMEPHQANLLDILTVITHRLVRYMVHHEVAIKDILKDYEIGGKNLMEAYERERQKSFETGKESLDMVKTSLSMVYGDAMNQLRDKAMEPPQRKTRGVDALAAQWNEQQEGCRKAINAALNAFSE